MSAVDIALKAAAEAIRALPDRDLLELALRAEGPGAPPYMAPEQSPPRAIVSAPVTPTAALRKEVATSAKRPTREGTSNQEFVARALSVLVSKAEPSGCRAVSKASGLSMPSTYRALQTLVAMGKATMRKQGHLVLFEVKR